jgi:outer membrane receptor protein involved in Fe transport
MKPINTYRMVLMALGSLILLPVTHLYSQTDSSSESDDQPVFELSPFEVSSSGDKGYYASNTISGSRISVPIQDIPLTIEVVTSEFIEDTGATDLRDSLKYSAGVMLQSQNDAFGLFDNAGNVNNPEGATGDKSDSSFKIRGFVLENTLRNGFRRKNATDTVNIDRIEVIRGPSALLYGVGNFGGIVNYLTKAPLPYRQQQIDLTVGSDGMKRASVDSTGPILKDSLGYRLTMAYEDRDDWTDLNAREHFFISPVIEWKPWEKVKLTLDYEYGEAEEDAVSFKSVRTPSLEANIFETDQLETFGFLEFTEDKNANDILDPGEDLNGNGQIDLTRDPRTFRWSGPDTYLNTTSSNFNASLNVELLEDLYYNGGVNISNVEFESRDVFGGISNVVTARALATVADMATDAEDANGNGILDPGEDLNSNGVLDFGRGIYARQIIDGKSGDTRIPIYGKVFQYNWNGSEEVVDWIQHRHELNYSNRILEGNRWLESEHNFLLGFSKESQTTDGTGFISRKSPDGDSFYYRDPTDESYIRFGPANPGDPDIPFEAHELWGNTAENTGKYLVYSGRFFQDRLFVIAGIRDDKTTSKDGYYEQIGSRKGREFLPDSTVSKTTSQFGVSVEIIDGLSVFALSSEGVEPNFDGQRDGLGRALESTVAEAEEFGFKFNLWDGKIAGTISKFKIHRKGFPITRWWAPAPVKGRFQRDKDIVFRLDDFNPDKKAKNADPTKNNPYHVAALPEWEAAKLNPEAVFTETHPKTGAEFTYLNASTTEGAAFLDAVFDALKDAFEVPFDEQGKDQDPWPGWLYEGADIGDNDDFVNNAYMDHAGGDNFVAIEDESTGWEAQIIMSPLENLQIILNYSNVNREILSPGQFVEFDWQEGNEDRWAPWFFPNAFWGLGGVPTDLVYPGGPSENIPNTDTSVWTGIGWGTGEAMDDTPKHTVSWWAHYTFMEDTPLSGLEIGFGGQWVGKKEYSSAITSAGQKKLNRTATSIKAFTDPQLTLNAMLKYSWRVKDKYDAYLQLNVDNFLDDKDQYGFIWAPGRSWKLNAGITF